LSDKLIFKFQISDLYFEAVSKKIWLTSEYGKCVSLWKHISGAELEEKISKILLLLEGWFRQPLAGDYLLKICIIRSSWRPTKAQGMGS
jgi:hypothetical protein